MRKWQFLPAALVVCALGSCSSGESSAVPTAPQPASTGSAVMVGTGDIAKCGSAGTRGTATLLDAISGIVFTTGDNVYESGTAKEYRDCYGPTWGRHRQRTRPAPGNHEYETTGAIPYFDYFGAAAGPRGRGYYSYRAGAWLVLSLNSEARMAPGSAQYDWLRSELSENPSACTLAYFHRPLFTSGPNGDNPDVKPLWDLLYAHQADVIVSGHDHIYERYAPQDPDGRFDPARGIRQFIVGTGGGDRYHIARTRSSSEARGLDWGVLKLTLDPASYAWEFIPVEGASFRDSGSGACR